MLKAQTLIVSGLLIGFLAAYVPMNFQEIAWISGIVMLAAAASYLRKGWLSSKDLDNIFSLRGLGTITAFFSLVLFGLKFLLEPITIASLPFIEYLAQLEPTHAVIVAAALIFAGVFGGDR